MTQTTTEATRMGTFEIFNIETGESTEFEGSWFEATRMAGERTTATGQAHFTIRIG